MPDEKKPIEIVSVRADKFETIYSNAAHVMGSTWDFSFIFSRILGTQGNVATIEERVEVLMSPQHAKAFLGLLAQHVQEYEKRLGEIRIVEERTVSQLSPSRFSN